MSPADRIATCRPGVPAFQGLDGTFVAIQCAFGVWAFVEQKREIGPCTEPKGFD